MANNAQQLIFATAAPTAASGMSYQYGDIVLNSSPAPGLPVGWFESSNATNQANYPGTWIPFGNVQPQAVISIPAASFNTLNTTAQTLIAAPGAGAAIVVNYILMETIVAGAAFTGGGVITIGYNGSTAVVPTIAASVITSVGTSTTQAILYSPTSTALTLTANAPIQISVATANFAGGTAGSVKLQIAYSIITL